VLRSNYEVKLNKRQGMFKKSEFLRRGSLGYFTLALGLTCVTSGYADYNRNDSSYSSVAVSDQELTKKIQDKISSGWFSKGNEQVNVQVNNGVATLQGLVEAQSDKERIEKEVRNIEGVKSVNSQLTVQEPDTKANISREFKQDTYATSEDDQLNKKIRDTTSRGWLWNSYQGVILNTTNGDVTLEGTVESNKDQQKLMKEIQKIDGVKTVKSNLRIKNP
jgi:osmotically-inducible protein OsmY